jgi:hypothetical protein
MSKTLLNQCGGSLLASSTQQPIKIVKGAAIKSDKISTASLVGSKKIKVNKNCRKHQAKYCRGKSLNGTLRKPQNPRGFGSFSNGFITEEIGSVPLFENKGIIHRKKK